MKKKLNCLILCLAAAALILCPVSHGESGFLPEDPEPAAVDLDLSALNSTLLYAQLYNLLSDPEPYYGKIIRMPGSYSAYEDEAQDLVYHACLVTDATACCSLGLEFLWAGEHAWPEDYPYEGDAILVTGRLEVYEENGLYYLRLADAALDLLPEN